MSDPKRVESEDEEGNDKPPQDFPDKRELKRIYEKAFKDMEYMEQYRVDTQKLGKRTTIILNSRNCESFNGRNARRFKKYFNDEIRAIKKGITPEKYIKRERADKIRTLRQQHDNNMKRLKNEMDRVIRGTKQLDKLIAGMEKNYLRIWQHEVRKKREKEFLVLKSLKEKIRKTFSELELKEYKEKIKNKAEKEHKPILEVEEEEARRRERKGIKTRQFDDLERIEQEAFLKEHFSKEIKNLDLEVNVMDKTPELKTKLSRILEFDDAKMIGEVKPEMDEIQEQFTQSHLAKQKRELGLEIQLKRPTDLFERPSRDNLMDKFLVEQSKILKAFFKDNERLRKIVVYDDQMDLPTLILMLRRHKAKLPGRHLEIPSMVFESRMQDELQGIKNEIGALRLRLKANIQKEKEKEITVPTEKKYGYNELLISMLGNVNPRFEISKDPISKEPSLKFTFDKTKAHENFFTILKEQYGIKATLERPLQFDGDYLITDLNEKSLRNLKSSLAKKNNKLIRYKELSANKMGLKIDFQEALMDLWAEFLKSQEKEVVKKRKQPIFREFVSKKEVKAIIGVVGITALIVMIIWGIALISRPTIIIEHGDDVKIYYQAWESDEDENYNPLSPIIDENVWVEMIPRTENSSGLMLGLYNNLLGKKKNYESDLIWLNRCIDEDLDGVDDNTGQPALSFGKSSDMYFDTCLMIKFKVLSIQS